MSYMVGDTLPDGSVVFYDKGRAGKKGWRYLVCWFADCPESLNWRDAVQFCKFLGVGWRLPSRKWLNWLYKARDKVPGLGDGWYWSLSQDYSDDFAWAQWFDDGLQDYGNKDYKFSVRACRALDEQGQPVEVE